MGSDSFASDAGGGHTGPSGQPPCRNHERRAHAQTDRNAHRKLRGRGRGMTVAPTPSSAQWFGHPRGLSTLFFTEMWERFSYYGMRALLILFMTASIAGENPGLEMPIEQAAAIYGLYTSL